MTTPTDPREQWYDRAASKLQRDTYTKLMPQIPSYWTVLQAVRTAAAWWSHRDDGGIDWLRFAASKRQEYDTLYAEGERLLD